jgi:hypothetical protein
MSKGEHGRERVAAALGATGIGHLQEGTAQAGEFLELERAACSAADDHGLLAIVGQILGAHPLKSMGIKGF